MASFRRTLNRDEAQLCLPGPDLSVGDVLSLSKPSLPKICESLFFRGVVATAATTALLASSLFDLSGLYLSTLAPSK